MKYAVSILVYFFTITLLRSQNLVPNPSFEILSSCPTGNSQIANATGWNRPPGSITTPDAFNTCYPPGGGTNCNNVNVPNNFGGFANAFHGNGYAGIMTYYGPSNNLREYIQAQLATPLVANTTYCVRFRIMRSSMSRYATNNLGIHISNGTISQTSNQPISTITPQIQVPGVIRDSANWTLVSGTYTAIGGENYITIGNYRNNAGTTVFNSGVSASTCALANTGAFYYIDSVFVGLCALPPIARITASDTVICEGACINFTDSTKNSPVSWNWSFPGGTPVSSTIQHPNNVCFSSAGIYTVTLIASNGTGADTATKVITVLAPPVAAIVGTSTVCPGSAASLAANPSGGTYSWSTGGSTQIINVVPGNSTLYTVTVNIAGCSDSASILISLYNPPIVSFTSDDSSGCPELCMNFNNTSPASVSQLWSFGDGTTSVSANPSHCYNTPGIYSVSMAITDNNGCSNSSWKSNYIKVYPPPTAMFIFSPSNPTLLNGTVYFTDQSAGASSWQWSFGDALNSSSLTQNPNFTYSDTGAYIVNLTVQSIEGCTDSVVQTVYIYQDFILYIPNTFTPNSDGMNDIFNVESLGVLENSFELFIYDRWGNMIFKTNDVNKGWDGRANNGADIAQTDTYVWKINLKDIIGSPHNFNGHINLLR